jgi:hypothetical protein
MVIRPNRQTVKAKTAASFLDIDDLALVAVAHVGDE